MNAPPLRFVFALHLHQPVGNFDEVFRQHLDDVYTPLLDALERAQFFPVVLHVSGPLLEWLDTHEPAWLDRVAALAQQGRIEPLLSGYDEPVLASLLRADRHEQVRRMAAAVHARFGVHGTGLWLTERVWEPDLAADLAEAGVAYALVDDRHFLVTGFEHDQLHQPWLTESDGRTLALFPIDERLRYLIPFRPPGETAAHLRELRARGHRLAVFADDGEKFGGWPGTKAWVYERGWLAQFIDAVQELVASGEVKLSTLAEALATVPPGGLAYLPTASYREMEGWSLPPDAATRLLHLERDLGTRLDGPDGALVRGAHWRNFLAKYPESNRMHKAAQRTSRLCRERGDPADVRRLVGRAQCNDAYWHGVFGGLYLPHLREAVWKNLAEAERRLRDGEPLAVHFEDVDGDGEREVLVTSSRVLAVIAPHRGGGLETFVRLHDGFNFADVLTRRREAYHDLGPDAPVAIALDHEPRAIFLERVLQPDLSRDAFAWGTYPVLQSWARTRFTCNLGAHDGHAAIQLDAGLGPMLRKSYRFSADGALEVQLEWEPGEGVFSSELSLFRPLAIDASPAAERWEHAVETVAKSERGLDRTVQGTSVTLRWPASLGAASIRLP